MSEISNKVDDLIDINNVFELRCKTTNYFGVGAINKFEGIVSDLKSKGFNNLLFVTGKRSYKLCGAWSVIEKILDEQNTTYEIYDKASANPTVDMIDEAKEMGLGMKADAVIGIGGGSPLDVAKSTAILLEHTTESARDLYKFKFDAKTAKPIVLINTTHGTGTEVNRFAVATIPEENFKPALVYDCIYPLYSIDDPALLTKLPEKQTQYTAVDAVNHVVEAATSIAASPYTINLAKRTIELVSRYLPNAIKNPNDLTARYWLLYASAIAGISFDNGLLHYTHALEHPLSALKPDLAHGLGLAVLLPAVVKYSHPAASERFAYIFEPIVKDVSKANSDGVYLAREVEQWLYSVGINEKLSDIGFNEGDVNDLTDLVKATPSLDILLSLTPMESTDEGIKQIYRDSMHSLS
ncbi:MAG: iron-containing alcohol dehydrogenase [Methanosarcinales archaeon]|jgi:alcohol dehydrogenase class IV|nr:iron-containing alcohol dehydrogenase [Methanosarcinales archaeon]